MKKQNNSNLDVVSRIRQSFQQGHPFTARVILCGIFALLNLSLASDGAAATVQGPSALTLRIEPEAAMTITPAGTETDSESGETIQLFNVQLAIRMNAGATASLTLEPAPESNGPEAESAGDSAGASNPADQSNPSSIVFTARQNGRYSVIIKVKSVDNSKTNSSVRLELTSSDQVLHLIQTL